MEGGIEVGTAEWGSGASATCAEDSWGADTMSHKCSTHGTQVTRILQGAKAGSKRALLVGKSQGLGCEEKLPMCLLCHSHLACQESAPCSARVTEGSGQSHGPCLAAFDRLSGIPTALGGHHAPDIHPDCSVPDLCGISRLWCQKTSLPGILG